MRRIAIRLTGIVSFLVGILILVSLAHAQGRATEPTEVVAPAIDSSAPVFWAWFEPQVPHDNLIRFVLHKCFNGNGPISGDVLADLVCDEIVTRGLAHDQIAVLIQGYGMGGNPEAQWPSSFGSPALTLHPGDWIEPPDPPEAYDYYRTPWMSNGIVECRAWLNDFIGRYKERQVLDDVPAPYRFHFDTEAHCDAFSPAQFDDMRHSDPRWDTEALPGHDGKTLATLYAEAGAPAYDPQRTYWHSDNRDFALWYGGVCLQAEDGGMNEAAYETLRAAFPGVKCSNYWTSCHLDGEGDPARVRIGRRCAGLIWWHIAYSGSGGLQAPVLYGLSNKASYPPDPDWIDWGGTWEEACLAIWRHNLEACIHSGGGGRQDDITPWIGLKGNIWEPNEGQCDHDSSPAGPLSKDLVRRQLSMLRAHSVDDEILVWNYPEYNTPDNWASFADIVRQVWGATKTTYSVTEGTLVQGEADSLRYALNDFAAIRAVWAGQFVVAVNVVFSTDFDDPQELRVIHESEVMARGGVTQHVYLLNYASGSFDWQVSNEMLQGKRLNADLDVDPAHPYISSDGEVTVRLGYTAPTKFAARLDLVQLVETDDEE